MFAVGDRVILNTSCNCDNCAWLKSFDYCTIKSIYSDGFDAYYYLEEDNSGSPHVWKHLTPYAEPGIRPGDERAQPKRNITIGNDDAKFVFKARVHTFNGKKYIEVKEEWLS